MTFAPMELEQLYKQEEICKKDKWTTPNGWMYPGFKSAVDNYVHPKKPSSARLKELSQVNWNLEILILNPVASIASLFV